MVKWKLFLLREDGLNRNERPRVDPRAFIKLCVESVEVYLLFFLTVVVFLVALCPRGPLTVVDFLVTRY